MERPVANEYLLKQYTHRSFEGDLNWVQLGEAKGAGGLGSELEVPLVKVSESRSQNLLFGKSPSSKLRKRSDKQTSEREHKKQ